MTNQDGQPIAIDELKGKWSLLFFGYTFCPDICPTTLAQLRIEVAQVLLELRRRIAVRVNGVAVQARLVGHAVEQLAAGQALG